MNFPDLSDRDLSTYGSYRDLKNRFLILGGLTASGPLMKQLRTSYYAWAALTLAVFTVYSVQLVVRRLYFHPLAKIPGPFLARSTYWYELYQDIILGGMYVKTYPALHEKYGCLNPWTDPVLTGPVIRASLDRIHVSDPGFFHEVYSSGSKIHEGSCIFPVAWWYSRSAPCRRRCRSMEALSHLVLKVVKNALRKAHEHHDEDKVLDIQRLYTGITIDTIMQVLCESTLNFIDATEREPPFLATLRTFSENFFVLKHFPILIWMAMNIPKSIAAKLIPGEFEFRANINQWIRDRAAEHELGVEKARDGRKTVIDLLLHPEDGGRPLTYQAVEDETAYSFAFAGTRTTSLTMSMGTYYLLSNLSKLQRLRDELRTVPKNDQGLYEYKIVRSLPYLNACIKESLRMSSPVPGIIPRPVPAGGMTWKGHYLPAGTSGSSSIRSVHDNPDIFPDPDQFIPEGWLANQNPDHYLVVFGKGSPHLHCVAWMETYLTFSNSFASLNMSLFQTNGETTDWTDCGNAMIKRHVKVKVDSVAW
ncbi:cytochrome P450 [Ilyonectria destructans]|nr:cytochrome P450 [Ilyonectria destructans]